MPKGHDASDKRIAPPPAMTRTPCMTRMAVELLRPLAKGARVCEVGAGGSTPWFCEVAASVLSIEDSPQWAAAVRKACSQFGIIEVLDVPTDQMAGAIRGQFDLVFIDPMPHKTRRDCIRAGARRVVPGGWLVADDYDFKAVRGAVDELRRDGWEVTTVHGLKSHASRGIVKTATAFCQRSA